MQLHKEENEVKEVPKNENLRDLETLDNYWFYGGNSIEMLKVVKDRWGKT